jgi:hypothetical protein
VTSSLDAGVITGISFELKLDLRRLLPFLITFLIRLTVLFELEELSVSLVLGELDEFDELDEPIMLAKTPGYDSSSIRACGVLSYIYACDLSWKSR